MRAAVSAAVDAHLKKNKEEEENKSVPGGSVDYAMFWVSVLFC